jgi:hypothetical protein
LALAGGIAWLYKHERERRETAERQISEHKHKAYIALLEVFFDMIKASKTGKVVNDKRLLDRMIDANKELILYGSDDVVRIYQKWIGDTRRGNASLDQFGELIVAIRRDMGHATTKIRSEEVLRQFITDYDEAKAKGTLVIGVGGTHV